MKPEELFPLQHADWPAFLVEIEGAVVCANGVAALVFGSVIEDGGIHLSVVWSDENSFTAEQFLSRLDGSLSVSTALKYRTMGGLTKNFMTHICPVSREGFRGFIFQVFQEGEAPSARLVSSETAAALDHSLVHKQKLDCALQLARTVALDFNNALTSVLGHASLLLSRTHADHPWRASLVEIEKSAARAAEVANDLANFSRQEKDSKVHALGNLNALLQRAVDAFRTPELAHISWNLLLERRLFVAHFDEAKIQQAFMKILENAVQALVGDGRITVQSRNLELHEATQDRTVKLEPGNYVCVEISDNGMGIPPDVLPRVFEPFFTTKGGSHRGLGLAWAYGIVTNHGGGVALSSQKGIGTSARLYLPAGQATVRESVATTADLNGHNEVILFVDDEDLLLTMGQTILTSFGYQVLTANSGVKALDLIAKEPQPVDLMITDLVMPSMSGRELIEHLQEVSPSTRILCTSGFVRSKSEDSSTYLQKPFTAQDLLRKVRDILSARSQPGAALGPE